MITNKDIENLIYPLYSDLRQTKWLFCKDTKYEVPSLAAMQEAIKKHSVRNLNMPSGADCDDRALQLMARIRLEFPLWPFGECSGILVGERFLPHDRNIAVVAEGLKIVEPENDSIMNPSEENYKIYWIRI